MKKIKKNETVNNFKVKRTPVSLFYSILSRYINIIEATIPSRSKSKCHLSKSKRKIKFGYRTERQPANSK